MIRYYSKCYLSNWALLLLTFMISIFQEPAFTQVPSSIWYFGNKAGLDFRTNPPTPLYNQNLNNQESNATITDEFGNLLFYVTADKVYNKSHLLMDNGSGLLGNGGSSAQGPMVLQDPNDPMRYYIFMTADETNPAFQGNLRYSMVDLCENNGLGKVIPQQKNILIPGSYSERITAIPLQNSKAYWILTSKLFENTVISLYLDSHGIQLNNPIESKFGSLFSPQVGQLKVNNQKTQILYSSGLDQTGNGVWLMDYDTLSGIASNQIQINNGSHAYGIEFSPDDNLVYFTSFYVISGLYQYNINSKFITTLFENNSNYYLASIQKDPQGNLIVSNGLKNFVSAVLDPNKPGFQCNFVQNYVNLLPNTSGHFSYQNTEHFFRNNNIDYDKQFLGPDTNICELKGIILNTNDPNTSWSNGHIGSTLFIDKAGTYWARRRVNCEIHIDTIKIGIIKTSPLMLPPEITICEGQADTLKVNQDLSWSDGSFGKCIVLNKAGIYWARLNHPCGDIQDTFVVNEIKRINTPLPLMDTTYCYDRSFNYEIILPGAVWSDGSKDKIIINKSGYFSYVIDNGCQYFDDELKITIDSIPLPLPDKIIACAAENIVLTSGNPNAIWSTGEIGHHIQVSKGGSYSYTLDNACGNFSYNTDVEFLEAVSASQIPNVFSPNGDHINDEFPGRDFNENFNLKIYSRWGELIFHGRNQSWDGFFKSSKMPAETYVFLMELDKCNTNKIFKGSVTLIR